MEDKFKAKSNESIMNDATSFKSNSHNKGKRSDSRDGKLHSSHVNHKRHLISAPVVRESVSAELSRTLVDVESCTARLDYHGICESSGVIGECKVLSGISSIQIAFNDTDQFGTLERVEYCASSSVFLGAPKVVWIGISIRGDPVGCALSSLSVVGGEFASVFTNVGTIDCGVFTYVIALSDRSSPECTIS